MREAFETIVVNPASAFTAVVVYALMQRSQTTLSALLNPWELGLLWWIAGYAVVRIALLGFIDGLVWVVGPRLPALPSRTGPKPVFQHKINTTDLVYLVVNSTIEFVF